MSEEPRHESYIFIIVGMAALVAIALMVQSNLHGDEIRYDATLNVLPAPSGAEKYPDADEPMLCSSEFSPVLDGGSKIKHKVMTPKLLPQRYSLQGVDVISSGGVEMITLYYWDKHLCDVGSNLVGGPLLNGAVVVRIADSLKVPDAHAEMISSVNRAIPKYDFEKLEVKGIPAIGNQPSNGLSTAGIGEESFPYPARIFVITNKMLYNIEANMPLENLIKIAESIS